MKGNSWDNQCIVTANNIHDYSGASQYGSTSTMAFNELTSTVSSSDYNKTGLGCWSTSYCPCSGSKKSTIYNLCSTEKILSLQKY